MMGNLGADPEVRHLPSGSRLAQVNVAINQGKDKRNDSWNPSTWITVKAFNATADALASFKKGDRIAVVKGKLSHDEWERDGQRRTKVYVTAFHIEEVTRRDNGDSTKSNSGESSKLDNLIKAINSAKGKESLEKIKTQALNKGYAFDQFEKYYNSKVEELEQLAELDPYDDIPF